MPESLLLFVNAETHPNLNPGSGERTSIIGIQPIKTPRQSKPAKEPTNNGHCHPTDLFLQRPTENQRRHRQHAQQRQQPRVKPVLWETYSVAALDPLADRAVGEFPAKYGAQQEARARGEVEEAAY